MLQRLFIRNVALIDTLEMEFNAGLNVLTGETGAGKSIIIDAVNLALGERASKELIKYGASKASVDAIFDISQCRGALKLLEDMEIENDGQISVSRELSANGKNLCRVNGVILTLTALKQLTDLLVDVHGQHEHQSLLMPASHIDFLDSYAAGQLHAVKAELDTLCASYAKLKAEQKEGALSEDELLRQTDILQYQIKEIESAKLSPAEEDELTLEYKLLTNSERVMSALEQCYSLLCDEEGAVPGVSGALKQIRSISELSAEYGETESRLNDAYYALEDVSFTVRDLKNAFEFDPQRLSTVEKRLDQIDTLKRKYGSTTAEILQFCKNARDRLESLDSSKERGAELDRLLREHEEKYNVLAAKLTQLRKAAAAKLEKQVLFELGELGMGKSEFSVFFGRSDGIHKNGSDKIEFLLSTNRGEPVKPLSKVASGGELSRIMLAFKTIFARHDSISTLIFDEIDTGISGKTAHTVGCKMVQIAGSHQVVCITHLPQIAALADAHFLVEKSEEDNVTKTHVRLLDVPGREAQLAQMMSGGDNSEIAREHAKELLNACAAEKEVLRKAPK